MDRLMDDELGDIAGRRSSTWWLLSRLVIEQPQDPWLAELEAVLDAVDADPHAPLTPESLALGAALRSARGQIDGLTALAVDRTRLLAGVLQKNAMPAPYESAALGQPMNSDQVVDVTECYRQAGLEDFGAELGPPDFLGTELRFMAMLAYYEMQAHRQGDTGKAAQWLALQRSFLDAHVLPWVPAHCERLAAASSTPFYAALAHLVGAACRLDRADLMQVSDHLSQQRPVLAECPEPVQ
jgi:TorA maturation chaperone TorD